MREPGLPTLTAVVVARDEEQMLPACISRLAFADEVLVVVDDRTTDRSVEVARAAGAQVHTATFESFAQFKNLAIDRAQSEWVLVVDADERVSAGLAHDVRAALNGTEVAHRVRIENWFYGSPIRRSGYRERPIRLLRRNAARYEGAIHEKLRFEAPEAPIGTLLSPLLHLSHRSVLDNLRKTAAYAEIQAAEMHAQGHPRVTRLTLARVVARQVGRHLIVGQGFRDGAAGFIESLYQPFSIFCVHVRLWELQQRPSIPERYERIEAEDQP